MRESFRPTTARTLSSTDKPYLSLAFLLSLKELPSAHDKRKLQDPSDSVVYREKGLRVLVQDEAFPMRNDSCYDGDRLVSFSVVTEDRTTTKCRQLKRSDFHST